jgi:outer membrane protein OmpA-like peptidoglycan-associated protein
VPFDYGNDFTIYQLADYYMQQATLFALDTSPSRVEVVGYAATTPWQVAGQTLQEAPELALARAERVAQWLRLTGVDPAIIEVGVGKEDKVVPMEGADGLREPSRRRVDVILHP